MSEPLKQITNKLTARATTFISRLLENALHAATWEGIGKAVKDMSPEQGKPAKLTQPPMAQLALAKFTGLFSKQKPTLAPILQATLRQFIAQDSLLFSLALLQDIAYSASMAEENTNATIHLKTTGTADSPETELPNIQHDGNYEHFVSLIAELIESCQNPDQATWARNFMAVLQASGLIGNTAVNNLERGITHLDVGERIRNLIQTTGETALAMINATAPATERLEEIGQNFLNKALNYWRTR